MQDKEVDEKVITINRGKQYSIKIKGIKKRTAKPKSQSNKFFI